VTTFAMARAIKSMAHVTHFTADLLTRTVRWRFKAHDIRADNGATLRSIAFRALCDDNNINLSFSATYILHHNALAERPWRTLAEMARCLLVTAGLPR
jgi:transposase InsO family protein